MSGYECWCIYVCVYIYIYIYIYVCVCVCVCVCARTCMYVYIHIYIKFIIMYYRIFTSKNNNNKYMDIFRKEIRFWNIQLELYYV